MGDGNTLRDVLYRCGYKQKFEKIRARAEAFLRPARYKFPDYTLHGLKHSEAIEALLNELLPGPMYLPPGERPLMPKDVFCLLSAAYLHDFGMYLARDRRRHGDISARYVCKNHETLGLNPKEAHTIATVCAYHQYRTNLLDLLDGFGDRNHRDKRALLAALLSLADALDINRDRASPTEFQAVRHSLGLEDKWHWVKNMVCSQPKVNAQEWSIQFDYDLPQAQYGFVGQLIAADIRREIERGDPVLRAFGIAYGAPELPGNPRVVGTAGELSRGCRPLLPDIVETATYIKADRSRIESSGELVGFVTQRLKEACGNPDLRPKALAGHVRQMFDAALSVRPSLFLLLNLRDECEPVLRGLSTDTDHEELGRVAARNAERGEQMLASLAEAGAQLVSNGETLLLFGYSYPVFRVLAALKQAKRHCTIYTPVCRPIGERDEVMVLKKLKGEDGSGFPGFVVPDAALPQLLATGQIGQLWMGCEGIVAPEMDVVNSTGAQLMARTAKAYGVETRVASGWSKIRPNKPAGYGHADSRYFFERERLTIRPDPPADCVNCRGLKGCKRGMGERNSGRQEQAVWEGTEVRPSHTQYPLSELVEAELIDLFVVGGFPDENGVLLPGEARICTPAELREAWRRWDKQI